MDELGWNPASVQSVEAVDAMLLARPILQEYDAFTVELATLPAEFRKQAARHNLVEIAEACWREAKLLNWPAGIQAQSNLWKW